MPCGRVESASSMRSVRFRTPDGRASSFANRCIRAPDDDGLVAQSGCTAKPPRATGKAARRDNAYTDYRYNHNLTRILTVSLVPAFSVRGRVATAVECPGRVASRLGN